MKQYIKPEIEHLAVEAYASMMLSSIKETSQIVSKPDNPSFMSKGDISDPISTGNDNGDDWPNYSAWDE